MTDHVISGLVKLRAELSGELQVLRQKLQHIDATLEILGYAEPGRIVPRFQRQSPPMFKAGELMALVGEAERTGHKDNVSITRWIMEQRNFDDGVYKRLRESVRDCKKRLNRRRTG